MAWFDTPLFDIIPARDGDAPPTRRTSLMDMAVETPKRPSLGLMDAVVEAPRSLFEAALRPTGDSGET